MTVAGVKRDGPRVGVAFISDRGDLYLPGCQASLEAAWPATWPEPPEVVIDDSAHLLGMTGAAMAGWAAADEQGWDYLLHVEEDFAFKRPLPLDSMVALLDARPDLANVVLMRNPVNQAERDAGGPIYAWGPNAEWWQRPATPTTPAHVEHRRGFFLNPCLIPRRVFADPDYRTGALEHGARVGVEAALTAVAVDGYDHRFAYYGHADDPPFVYHLGDVHVPGHRW